MNFISKISLKDATKMAAYASGIKACLEVYDCYEYLYNSTLLMQYLYIVAWIVITIFFFSLYKNMN